MRTHDHTRLGRSKASAHAVGDVLKHILIQNAVVVAVAAPGHNRNEQHQGAAAFVNDGFRAVFGNGKELFVAVAAGFFLLEMRERRFDVAVFALIEHGVAQFP